MTKEKLKDKSEKTAEKEPEQDPEIIIIDTQATLKCVLTPNEKMQLADGLAQDMDRIQRLNRDLVALVSEMKGKIKEVEARIQKDASLFRQGYEMRSVAIQIYKNYRVGKVSKIRLDTQEQYDERAMTGDERQQFLPLPPTNGGEKQEQKALPESPPAGEPKNPVPKSEETGKKYCAYLNGKQKNKFMLRSRMGSGII